MTRQGKKKAVSACASGLGQVAMVGVADRKNRANGANGESGRRANAANGRRATAATASGVRKFQTNGRHANGKSRSTTVNLQVIAAKETNGHAANGKHAVKNGVGAPVTHANGAANGQGAANGNVVAAPHPILINHIAVGLVEKVSRPVAQDRELVDRCLAKDVGAWSQMYARFHGSLIASVRAFLGQAGRDAHLVEEIAARVWYALVRDDFWLLSRFDVRRGCRLSTFLSLIAKAQARLLLRSERRRKSREMAVAREEVEQPQNAGLYSLTGEEFIATLSPAEKRFLVDVLVASTDRDARDQYSSQNLWQLRRRVREKLIKFLE